MSDLQFVILIANMLLCSGIIQYDLACIIERLDKVADVDSDGE